MAKSIAEFGGEGHRAAYWSRSTENWLCRLPGVSASNRALWLFWTSSGALCCWWPDRRVLSQAGAGLPGSERPAWQSCCRLQPDAPIDRSSTDVLIWGIFIKLQGLTCCLPGAHVGGDAHPMQSEGSLSIPQLVGLRLHAGTVLRETCWSGRRVLMLKMPKDNM